MANNTKAINIKITESAPGAGPFNILDESGNVLKGDVSLDELVSGIALNVPGNDISISITSSGNCTFDQYVPLKEIENEENGLLTGFGKYAEYSDFNKNSSGANTERNEFYL